MRTEPFPPLWLSGYPRAGFLLGDYIPPLFVTDLLAEVGRTDAARDEQDAAITAWLETHEPSLGLVYSLTDFGYFRRRAGGRRAGRRMARAAAQAAWERAIAAGLVG